MSEANILSYKRKVAGNLICVYSAAKIGKTSLLETLADEPTVEESIGKRVYIVDVDHGLEPLFHRWVSVKGKPTHTNAALDLCLGTTNQFDVKVCYGQEDFHNAVWKMPPGYDYYVIDTFTRAGRYFIRNVQEKDSEGNPIPGERARDANMDIAYLFEDYIDRFEEIAWEIKRENDAWLIINCHEKAYRKPKETSDSVCPLLYGSAGAKLERVAAGIWRIQLVHVERDGELVTGRVFRTAATDSIAAGDRTNALNVIEPANYAKMFQKIRAFRAAVPQPPKKEE